MTLYMNNKRPHHSASAIGLVDIAEILYIMCNYDGNIEEIFLSREVAGVPPGGHKIRVGKLDSRIEKDILAGWALARTQYEGQCAGWFGYNMKGDPVYFTNDFVQEKFTRKNSDNVISPGSLRARLESLETIVEQMQKKLHGDVQKTE